MTLTAPSHFGGNEPAVMSALGECEVRRVPRIALIAGLLVFPFIAGGTLNHSGFCFGKLRYLSDDEKIDAAVDHLAAGDLLHWYRVGPQPDDWRAVHMDRPETVHDFLAADPDCCRIVPGGGDGRRPTFLGRVLGQVSDVVEIDHVRHFVDDRGVVQAEPVRSCAYVSPCGTVVNDFLP
jgi:hypothetical protein